MRDITLDHARQTFSYFIKTLGVRETIKLLLEEMSSLDLVESLSSDTLSNIDPIKLNNEEEGSDWYWERRDRIHRLVLTRMLTNDGISDQALSLNLSLDKAILRIYKKSLLDAVLGKPNFNSNLDILLDKLCSEAKLFLNNLLKHDSLHEEQATSNYLSLALIQRLKKDILKYIYSGVKEFDSSVLEEAPEVVVPEEPMKVNMFEQDSLDSLVLKSMLLDEGISTRCISDSLGIELGLVYSSKIRMLGILSRELLPSFYSKFQQELVELGDTSTKILLNMLSIEEICNGGIAVRIDTSIANVKCMKSAMLTLVRGITLVHGLPYHYFPAGF